MLHPSFTQIGGGFEFTLLQGRAIAPGVRRGAWRCEIALLGWSDQSQIQRRAKNLQRLVQNSRFLILPWVKVRNLASRILAPAARELIPVWRQHRAALARSPYIFESSTTGITRVVRFW